MDVFKNRVSKIPVAFLIQNYDGNDTYTFEVKTNVDATVTASGETRHVIYGGEVSLWEFSQSPQPAPPTATFLMPFHLIFERLPA